MNRQRPIQIAERLQLTAALTAVCSGERLCQPFDIFLGFPSEFYLMSDDERAAGGWNAIVALWDDGNFGRIVAFDESRQTLVALQAEVPGSIDLLPPLGTQQALFLHFLAMYEAELSVEELHHGAQLLGFQHLDRMLLELESNASDRTNWSSQSAWQADFLARIKPC